VQRVYVSFISRGIAAFGECVFPATLVSKEVAPSRPVSGDGGVFMGKPEGGGHTEAPQRPLLRGVAQGGARGENERRDTKRGGSV